ncbi:hypothetical protein BOX15_Mlig014624g3 [Macrostomum lignano]|uniref:Wbp11/ELF5/Saf1 N-terminal domain-containing protein n=1 Tax=Macrostomum lignano TaxID=282301 RepID=A0A267GL89_9PLAT|nr:hypothetical protein BOX15_Mlig014624g3 [Macrostomum lignano]
MGRRAVGTTKTGRFMNPTDQARKEARKRELKKNKKQRMQVRTSVLKARQPDQILIELEEYDKMELDPSAEADIGGGSAVGFSDGERLALRVIQEKRRKLLETYDRILSMVQRESPDEAGKLVAARQEYEQRRQQRALFYEQVRAAENVDTSSIPLPSLPPGATQAPGFPPVFPAAPSRLRPACSQLTAASCPAF